MSVLVFIPYLAAAATSRGKMRGRQFVVSFAGEKLVWGGMVQ